MNVEKKTSEYTIYKRRDGRYAVRGKDKTMVHGDDKAKILLAEGLIKQSVANPNKAAEVEAPAEQTEADGGAE